MSVAQANRPQRPFALLDRPWIRTALRVALGAVVAVYFVFALLILALRLVILPQIEHYRPSIERMLGAALERPVGIREIEAYWVGLRPALSLKGLDIRDSEGRSALRLEQVETELAWDSLLFLQLRLSRLEIVAPDLVLRRNPQGHFFAAGLEFDPQAETGAGFADWLLAQHQLVVRDATIRWMDEKRQAPPLELAHLNFELDNRFNRHRFGFTAEPPRELAAKLDVRGDFKGRDLNQIESWQGQIYADLEYADLAAWRQWVDYPVALPRGLGAVRAWLDIDQKLLVAATADVRLADVRLQIQPGLPELDLTRLDGRLAGRRLARGFSLEFKDLRLIPRDGLPLSPRQLKLTVQKAGGGQPAQGELVADDLDLAAMAQLASYLPLDEDLRGRLNVHRPNGRLNDVDLAWHGDPGAFSSWKVKARFSGVGLSALGPIPGLSGINGRVDGDHTGGRILLDGKDAGIDLPEVFAEPRLALESMAAEIGWRPAGDGIEINLQKASFANRDAAGEASGRWHSVPDGPGSIDLGARLTRADGNAVWRYMPLVVGSQTRDWLRHGIVGGSGREATLRLRGDLAKFPFRDGKDGIFQVKGSFRGATLRYADDWPPIEDIDGELLFEGVRMLITAHKGQLYGIAVKDARAEIADLLQTEEILTVSGKAAGPTADFLRFIEASPVGERIDHFTQPMTAQGRGELDIKLRLPLRKIDTATLAGDYRIDGNQLAVDPDLPPLTDVRGRILFGADSLDSKGLRANLLGAPLAIDIRTTGDNAVTVTTGGEMSIAALRRQFSSPLLDHLAGGTRWEGKVKIRKRAVEVALTSQLNGISSALPAPFNKTVGESLPLRFERKPAPPPVAGRVARDAKVSPGGTAPATAATASVDGGGTRDMIEVALGRDFRAQLVRRRDGNGTTLRRGAVALGSTAVGAFPATLPDNAIRIDGNLPVVDADFWRNAFGARDAAPATSATPATLAATPVAVADEAALPPLLFDLHADELRLFGRHFNDIRVAGGRQATLTRFDLKSPDFSGNFTWDAVGSGRLSGRIGQLAIPESVSEPEHLQSRVGEIVEDLPALDLTVDKLSFKKRELGRLTMNAENRDGYWNAKLDLHNDDADLKAGMKWRPAKGKATAPAETRLDFDLDAKSVEKLLARTGYPDSMKRGTARLNGKLAWRGAPFPIDYPTLTGKLDADAANGQFTKLEPGVGRLLGVLSLQSLPRRITLDFRDVFSEGFAFDHIKGEFDVNKGIMHTSGLRIQGPAAKVLMSGGIDLGGETQDLKVRVEPAVGESIAVGAMLANPVAGAVAWVAQKLLKNPLDQAFAFEYAVTGSWKEPKVEKLGQVQNQARKAAEEKDKN